MILRQKRPLSSPIDRQKNKIRFSLFSAVFRSTIVGFGDVMFLNFSRSFMLLFKIFRLNFENSDRSITFPYVIHLINFIFHTISVEKCYAHTHKHFDLSFFFVKFVKIVIIYVNVSKNYGNVKTYAKLDLMDCNNKQNLFKCMVLSTEDFPP